MQPQTKYTRLKIITGYATLFLLSLSAVTLIYKQITRLAVNEYSESGANRKLLIIGNLTTGLYEAESFSNAFVQTGTGEYFHRYLLSVEEVENNIDSLKKSTASLEQQLRIDSINILLKEKVQNLEDLVEMKRSLTPDNFYAKAITTIESGKDSIHSQVNISQKLITTRDSTYVKTEKKRGWWIFSSKSKTDSVLNVTVSRQLVIDSVKTPVPGQNTDTVLNILRSAWQNTQEKSRHVSREINRKEYALIRQSAHITEQLRRILRAYEKEEIHRSFQKIEKREQVVATTTKIIAWIAVAAIVTILFFIFFILRDLSRSLRYRRELENANQYADRLLKSKEKMILTVTHDIKSPLSSIMGYIELLGNMPGSERQRYFLRNMKGSSEHILKLVTNLLDFSKLENNKIAVEEVIFNPGLLLREISDNFMPLAKEKHLALRYETSGELNRDYRGDALRIRQIVTNILSNAVKYTSEGEIRFTASIPSSTRTLTLTVHDTGPGMTTEEQELIFREFTRLSTPHAAEGTGLGLTITLKLTELLGGRITLDSTPGKGSCFHITLPLKEAGNSSPAPADPPLVPADKQKPLNILLVDDDPLQLEMTAALLANNGFHADTTTRPREVPARLAAKHYDLLFSDIQMPEMDGFELVKHIRALSGPMARIPAVALSANTEKKEADYLRAGFTASLGKPFTSAQLLQLIAKLTGQALPPAGLPAGENTGKKTHHYTLKNILPFTDNDPAALKKILEDFTAGTRQHLSLLEQHRQKGEFTGIARVAHKMLPMFRQLEITAVIPLLEKLERSGSAPLSESETGTIIEQITKQAGLAIEELEHHSNE